MAALTERFQGLRRPGASLLKKGLPQRPDEPVIARKAVPPPKVEQPATTPAPPPASIASKYNSQPPPPPPQQQQRQQQQLAGPPVPGHKTLPSLPTSPAPVSPPPSSSLPPTPAASSPASAATITPSTTSSPPPQQSTQSGRPPRTSSLTDPQPAAPPYSEKRPQHRLVANLQANNNNNNLQVNSNLRGRPVSEAPSISQFIPDPEPEPEFDPETAGGRRSDSENSSDHTTTPTSSTRNSDSNSNGSGVSSTVFKQYPDGYIPPIPETIVIPPLTDVHYQCFTSHAAMPASSNVWYATACMACKKVDQEVRHRCTFCCMRICASCFESLRQCKNRDLNELMTKVDN